jgi:hypothetical protein
MPQPWPAPEEEGLAGWHDDGGGLSAQPMSRLRTACFEGREILNPGSLNVSVALPAVVTALRVRSHPSDGDTQCVNRSNRDNSEVALLRLNVTQEHMHTTLRESIRLGSV